MTSPSPPDTLAKESAESFSSVSSANLTMPPPAQGSNAQYYVCSSSASYHSSSTAAATASSGSYQAEPRRTDQRPIDPSPSSPGSSVVAVNGNDSEWQNIRHKQQRLLLLRHASMCQYEEAGKCPVTPHCTSMKRLWEHMEHCRNQQCTV